MTFSIVAYEPENNEWGIAVQSKFVAVGTIVPFAKAGIGAIATQAYANTSYGPKGLGLLEMGFSADEVIQILTTNDPNKEQRQVGIVDANGKAASFTGSECFDWAGHVVGENYCCQGNILVSETTVQAMAKAYEQTPGDLVAKLFAALEAGQKAGGDKRGKESAAILIVKEEGAYDGGTDRYIDIRVDEHPEPIKELRKVFEVYNLCLLKRDDPKDIVKIEGEVLANIYRILVQEGFYEGEIPASYTSTIKEALIKWMHTNNFEVKERDDDYLFGSVYRYITKQLQQD
ncbi:MAG: DUF1028 domain-containing protein [Candidatus Heimdallarchaeota archaeon]|nr:DUF1028 domain-containing protein [Candidatus Heimdallarchaeota archaeon]